MDKPTVYIETTIVSVLTARTPLDPVKLADQIITRNWWDTQRSRFDLFTSQLVVLEARAGHPDAARRRLEVLTTLPIAPSGDNAVRLAADLIRVLAVPAKEQRDALHIATAAANGITHLLTWNCTHLANAERRNTIAETCAAAGFRPPLITTPRELFAEATHD
jgi:hypothetical protein